MHTVNDILDKIIMLKGLKNDTALAKLFRVRPTTVSNWRKRSTVPYELIVTLCEEEGWSLNWLLAGQVETKYIETDIEGEHLIETKAVPHRKNGAKGSYLHGPYSPYSPEDSSKTLKERKEGYDRKAPGKEESERFCRDTPKWKRIVEEALAQERFPELEAIIEAFIEVITSNNEGMRLALTQNTLMFQQAVRDSEKVLKLETDIAEIKRLLDTKETDFKTQESPGESRQPGEKHRVGGK